MKKLFATLAGVGMVVATLSIGSETASAATVVIETSRHHHHHHHCHWETVTKVVWKHHHKHYVTYQVKVCN
jgi:hypothetical protein